LILLAGNHSKSYQNSFVQAYHGDIYELGYDISSLLWHGAAENHALDPLSEAIEHDHRSLEPRRVTQTARICVLLEIVELQRKKEY